MNDSRIERYRKTIEELEKENEELKSLLKLYSDKGLVDLVNQTLKMKSEYEKLINEVNKYKSEYKSLVDEEQRLMNEYKNNLESM